MRVLRLASSRPRLTFRLTWARFMVCCFNVFWSFKEGFGERLLISGSFSRGCIGEAGARVISEKRF